MLPKNEMIETTIIQKTNNILIYFLTSLILGTIISMFLAIHFSNPIYILFGFIIFWVGPFIILKRLRKPYTKKICINLTGDSLTIDMYNNKTYDLESHIEYYLCDIKTFQSYTSSKGDTNRLWLELRNGERINYTFINQWGNDVTSKIKDFILYYNEKQKSQDDKIIMKPNFYATKIGNYAVIFVGIGWICLLLFQLTHNPKTIPFTSIGGIAFFLTIWAQRKKDRNQYNKNQ